MGLFNRQPNGYIFGDYVFAEFIDKPFTREKWRIQTFLPLKTNDFYPTNYTTDTYDNALALVNYFDSQYGNASRKSKKSK